MLLLAEIRENQPNADLQTVQNQQQVLFTNTQKGLGADLQTVQNPEHTLISNEKEGPAR